MVEITIKVTALSHDTYITFFPRPIPMLIIVIVITAIIKETMETASKVMIRPSLRERRFTSRHVEVSMERVIIVIYLV